MTKQQLLARIEAMSPAERLLLAAQLAEAGKLDLAEVLAFEVSCELHALQVQARQVAASAAGDRR